MAAKKTSTKKTAKEAQGEEHPEDQGGGSTGRGRHDVRRASARAAASTNGPTPTTAATARSASNRPARAAKRKSRQGEGRR
jgi:hypothetical protein